NKGQKTTPSAEEKAKDLLNYKDVSELPKEESDTLPTLYVFRHGQTEDNAKYIFSGWRDPDLTEEGRKQALILAEKLEDKKLDLLISSPQVRALDTMKLGVSLNVNAKDKEIETDERIKERSYGDLQGTSKMELQLKDPELLKRIRRGYYEVPTNGESMEMVCQRVASFCDQLVERMKREKINVAISCHGNSFRGFRQYFEHLKPEEIEKLETPLGQDYAAYVIR
ncbi:MAG: histidine phosphatase family protein, partial [Patescibacteria group bacterium]